MKIRSVLLFLCAMGFGSEAAAAPPAATSGNPVFDGWYADPEGAVLDGQYWIFPTHSARYDEQTFFDAFSSPDLVHWKKHPRVLDTSIIDWARRAMWAPSVIEKDGKSYLFFSANDIQRPGGPLYDKDNPHNHTGGIGVAVANAPAGPYRDHLGKPLLSAFINDAQPIDQFVFRDTDGTYYMYYGGWRHCNVGVLNDDFTGFVPDSDGKRFTEITPEGYVEGPVLFLRDGKYYFLWSEGSWGNSSYKVAYAIADNPRGPFQRIGTILASDEKIATGAGHNSVIQAPGADGKNSEWYIVYHRRPIPNKGRDHRVTCIDRLEFNDDGTIKQVKMTREGVAPRPLKTAALRDADQHLERTCFQTGRAWDGRWNLRSDVALVYGIDKSLPDRIQSYRDRGYGIHVMTGVSWGEYQDYLYGRFDGTNHEDEAQTVSDGRKSSHGGDVYYMCPSESFGRYLCTGVQRALDAGAKAVHLEEPEFWVNAGYSEAFKREWQAYYDEPWQPPHSSVDAQWRASKLKYYLYRRTLEQVFDYVSEYNQRTGRDVRCYVPTHSLINYANWKIVSPESSLARIDGCDGYIAQVWTGTARTPNVYRGIKKERTFETAFLEYGSMQNLVRATGRTVWYLNDPIEDNPDHDWDDYRRNWESTLTASLLQPEVWQYEVAPWPERIFRGRYPRRAPQDQRQAIPPAYATELQTVFNALNDMRQDRIEWDCGTGDPETGGIGVIVSDSLMFQRGAPSPSDPDLSHFYGLALPLLKRGVPVAPIQLENLVERGYLDGTKILLMSYHGLKPLTSTVHKPLAEWVRQGGVLLFIDDDTDPFNAVREWWNTDGREYATPREALFEQLGFDAAANAASESPHHWQYGDGAVTWLREDPTSFAKSTEGDQQLHRAMQAAAAQAGLPWRETNYLVLRRGPYIIAAGLDELISEEPHQLPGRYVDLFDPTLAVQNGIEIAPGSRHFLRDLDDPATTGTPLVASACKMLPTIAKTNTIGYVVEGVANTPGVALLRAEKRPKSITLDGHAVEDFDYSTADGLLWIRFANEARPRELVVGF